MTKPLSDSKKTLEPQELEDRMVALNFRREGIRKQPSESHQRSGADILTVRYPEDEEEEEQQGGGGGGEAWQKLRRARKRVSALESLRRR